MSGKHRRPGAEGKSNDSFEPTNEAEPLQDALPPRWREGLVSSMAHIGSSMVEATAEDEVELSMKLHKPESKKQPFTFEFAHAKEDTDRASHIANIALRPYAAAVNSVYWEAMVGKFSCLEFIKRQFQEILCPNKLKSE